MKGKGDLLKNANAKKAPKYLNITLWSGDLDLESRMKHSRFVPCSFLLFGERIKMGTTPLSSSYAILVRESLKGPPASIEPSPLKLME